MFLEVSEANGVVWFIVGSVCKQFWSFFRAFNIRIWCSSIHHFSARILIEGFNGLGTVVLSLISKKPWSRFLVELMMILLCQCWILRRVVRSRLLRWFNGGNDDTALLSLFLLMIGSVRIQDTFVCLGHWFSCSLLPGMPLNSPWKLAASILSWSLTLPIKEQQR